MKDLSNKKVLFIICGGISAYKSLETIRMFRKNNAEIKTILTKSAKEFVTPLSVATDNGVTNSFALLVSIVFISALFFLNILIVSRLL